MFSTLCVINSVKVPDFTLFDACKAVSKMLQFTMTDAEKEDLKYANVAEVYQNEEGRLMVHFRTEK